MIVRDEEFWETPEANKFADAARQPWFWAGIRHLLLKQASLAPPTVDSALSGVYYQQLLGARIFAGMIRQFADLPRRDEPVQPFELNHNV